LNETITKIIPAEIFRQILSKIKFMYINIKLNFQKFKRKIDFTEKKEGYINENT